MTTLPKETLRVGFVGTGFIARFHLQSLLGVRHVEVTGLTAARPKTASASPRRSGRWSSAAAAPMGASTISSRPRMSMQFGSSRPTIRGSR
ncbi:ornithine cyclodeaminase/alanine dehydrogenase-like protein (mu-crystallin family) [Sinorhizobium fredii]